MPHQPRNRLREWSYQKRRRRATGQLGRPPSPIPATERRRQARQRYAARIRDAGMVSVRVLLTADDVRLLDENSVPADRSRGATILRLLRSLPG